MYLRRSWKKALLFLLLLLVEHGDSFTTGKKRSASSGQEMHSAKFHGSSEVSLPSDQNTTVAEDEESFSFLVRWLVRDFLKHSMTNLKIGVAEFDDKFARLKLMSIALTIARHLICAHAKRLGLVNFTSRMDGILSKVVPVVIAVLHGSLSAISLSTLLIILRCFIPALWMYWLAGMAFLQIYFLSICPLVHTVVVAPIKEEICYRAQIYFLWPVRSNVDSEPRSALRLIRRHVPWMIASSLSFAIVHYNNYYPSEGISGLYLSRRIKSQRFIESTIFVIQCFLASIFLLVPTYMKAGLAGACAAHMMHNAVTTWPVMYLAYRLFCFLYVRVFTKPCAQPAYKFQFRNDIKTRMNVVFLVAIASCIPPFIILANILNQNMFPE